VWGRNPTILIRVQLYIVVDIVVADVLVATPAAGVPDPAIVVAVVASTEEMQSVA